MHSSDQVASLLNLKTDSLKSVEFDVCKLQAGKALSSVRLDTIRLKWQFNLQQLCDQACMMGHENKGVAVHGTVSIGTIHILLFPCS